MIWMRKKQQIFWTMLFFFSNKNNNFLFRRTLLFVDSFALSPNSGGSSNRLLPFNQQQQFHSNSQQQQLRLNLRQQNFHRSFVSNLNAKEGKSDGNNKNNNNQQKKKKKKNANAYASTITLPETEFSQRANAVKREPEIQAFWKEHQLYDKLTKIDEDGDSKETFVLHDGPPYANGDLHIGHALNKVLKDFINRKQLMKGKRV